MESKVSDIQQVLGVLPDVFAAMERPAPIEEINSLVERLKGDLARRPDLVGVINADRVRGFLTELTRGYSRYVGEKYKDALVSFREAYKTAPPTLGDYLKNVQGWERRCQQKIDEGVGKVEERVGKMLASDPSREALLQALDLVREASDLLGAEYFKESLAAVKGRLTRSDFHDYCADRRVVLLHAIVESLPAIITKTYSRHRVEEAIASCKALSETYYPLADEIRVALIKYEDLLTSIEEYDRQTASGRDALKVGAFDKGQAHLETAYGILPERMQRVDTSVFGLLKGLRDSKPSWDRAIGAWRTGDDKTAQAEFRNVLKATGFPVYERFAARAALRADPQFGHRASAIRRFPSLQNCLDFWRSADSCLPPSDDDEWAKTLWERFVEARRIVVDQITTQANKERRIEPVLVEVRRAIELYKKDADTGEYWPEERTRPDFTTLETLRARLEERRTTAEGLVREALDYIRPQEDGGEDGEQRERARQEMWEEARQSFSRAMVADPDSAIAQEAMDFFRYIQQTSQEVDQQRDSGKTDREFLKRTKNRLQHWPDSDVFRGEAMGDYMGQYRPYSALLNQVDEALHEHGTRVNRVWGLAGGVVVLIAAYAVFARLLPLWPFVPGPAAPPETEYPTPIVVTDTYLPATIGRIDVPVAIRDTYFRQPSLYGVCENTIDKDGMYFIAHFQNDSYLVLNWETNNVISGEGYVLDPNGQVLVFNAAGTDYYPLPKTLGAMYLKKPAWFGNYASYQGFPDYLGVTFESGRVLWLDEKVGTAWEASK